VTAAERSPCAASRPPDPSPPLPRQRVSGRQLAQVLVVPAFAGLAALDAQLLFSTIEVADNGLRLGRRKRLGHRYDRVEREMHAAVPVSIGSWCRSITSGEAPDLGERGGSPSRSAPAERVRTANSGATPLLRRRFPHSAKQRPLCELDKPQGLAGLDAGMRCAVDQSQTHEIADGLGVFGAGVRPTSLGASSWMICSRVAVPRRSRRRARRRGGR
jgi:hypothetical protein